MSRSSTLSSLSLSSSLLLAGALALAGCSTSPVQLRPGVYGPERVFPLLSGVDGDVNLTDPFLQPYGTPPASYRAFPGVAAFPRAAAPPGEGAATESGGEEGDAARSPESAGDLRWSP